MSNLWDNMRQGFENSSESVAICVLGESIQAQLRSWIETKLKEVLDVDEQEPNSFGYLIWPKWSLFNCYK